MNNLIVEPAAPALIARLAADFAAKVKEALQGKERFCWGLSGGHTPRLLYETLAREPYASAVNWARLWIFWGDERPVPPDHPDSNYRMAHDALLRHVPIPPSQIFRIEGEKPPAQAAWDYQQ